MKPEFNPRPGRLKSGLAKPIPNGKSIEEAAFAAELVDVVAAEDDDTLLLLLLDPDEAELIPAAAEIKFGSMSILWKEFDRRLEFPPNGLRVEGGNPKLELVAGVVEVVADDIAVALAAAWLANNEAAVARRGLNSFVLFLDLLLLLSPYLRSLVRVRIVLGAGTSLECEDDALEDERLSLSRFAYLGSSSYIGFFFKKSGSCLRVGAFDPESFFPFSLFTNGICSSAEKPSGLAND